MALLCFALHPVVLGSYSLATTSARCPASRHTITRPKQKYPRETTREPPQFCTVPGDAMAAVTSTASLCPAAGLPSSSSSPFRRSKPSGGQHGRLLTATACHCRPARMEGVDRREALLGILLAAVAAPALAPADAPAAEATEQQESGFTTYEDEANKFSIAVPQGWLIGAGESSGIKSVTAFYPEQAGAADSNVSVAITGIGPDFTSLKSFGDVDAFAEGLVNGLDRSWQRPPGLAAKLIDSKAANGLYYVEYTLQNPGERRRHILSAIGMAFNGWYNRLYTVTGQYIDDEESEKYKPQIEQAVRSFRLT